MIIKINKVQFMKVQYLTLILLFLSSCNSFDKNIIDNPKYSSGKEYGTNKKISPKVLSYDDYTFVLGYSDKGSSMGCYYKNKELLYHTGGDGFYDTIYKANFNNDDITDFLVVYSMEDYSVLSALISISKDSYIEKEIGDPFGNTYCLVGEDTLKTIQYITIKDINNDKKDEVLINMATINNKLIGIYCSDTIYVDNKKKK